MAQISFNVWEVWNGISTDNGWKFLFLKSFQNSCRNKNRAFNSEFVIQKDNGRYDTKKIKYDNFLFDIFITLKFISH